MARQLRIEYEGALYHVIARGNEQKKIYSTDKDREKFLDYVQRAHERFGVKIHAYCLMSNHYHLLIETPQANLSRGMQCINSGYTTYYNLKQKRAGHLFQGRYRAILVEKDVYLQELSRYIHLNPVRKKIVENPEEYQWGSYQYYLGRNKKIPEYMEIKTILELFGNKERYREFVMDGVRQEVVDLSRDVRVGCILGGEEFVEEIRGRYFNQDKKSEDIPALRQFKRERKDFKMIREEIDKSKRLNDKDKKKVLIYFIRKYMEKTLGEIAKELLSRKSSSAVSKLIKRLDERRVSDNNLDRIMKDLESKMSKVKV